MAEQGGTTGFEYGNLKRQLADVTLFYIKSSVPAGGGETTYQNSVRLKGLSGVLKLGVAATYVDNKSNNQQLPAPLPGAVCQIVPINKTTMANAGWLRPVFQDPTVTDNSNAPLPAQLPVGWEGSFTTATDMEVQVSITDNAFINTGLDGRIVVQITVEYDGKWWDIQAIERAIGQCRFAGDASEAITIGSQAA